MTYSPSQKYALLIGSVGILILIAALGAVKVLIPAFSDPVSARDFIEAHWREGKAFNAHHYVLDNGLELVVAPRLSGPPVATHMIWYKAGAADEPRGQSGIAHFLEHLMFKGSGDLAPGAFSRTIKSLGGRDNAFTSQNYTAYFQSLSVDHLPTAIQMEADRMRGLHPPLKEVLSERNVILEERRQRTGNSPSAKLYEQLRAAHFINHPYGVPVIGWQHEMERLNWDMAKGFYDRHYAPNNAVVVVSGKVHPEKVYEFVKKTYGAMKPATLPAREWSAMPPLSGEVKVIMRDDAVRQPQVNLLFSVPSAPMDKETSLALEIAQEIMGGGASARLYKRLVIEQKIASSVSFSYNPVSRGPSELWISAYPVQGVAVDALKEAIIDQLTLLSAEGIREDELQSAIIKAQDSAIFARDGLDAPAMVIGAALASGLSLNDVEYWPSDIARITAQDVQNAARLYLNPDHSDATRMSYGALLPAATQTDGGRE